MIPSSTDSTPSHVQRHSTLISQKTCRPSQKHTHKPHFLTNASTLPPPGPTHYAARRLWWLTPTPANPPQRTTPSSARLRLEQLLSQPGAAHSNNAWHEGVEKVWKGLLSGGTLRRRLPLDLVIKVIHAGWLRDPETWPAGAVVPDSDVDPPPTNHAAPAPSSAVAKPDREHDGSIA